MHPTIPHPTVHKEGTVIDDDAHDAMPRSSRRARLMRYYIDVLPLNIFCRVMYKITFDEDAYLKYAIEVRRPEFSSRKPPKIRVEMPKILVSSIST